MTGGRRPRRIGVPGQKIERQRRLPLHVVIDDEGPDEILGAQHVEGVRHGRGFEIAGRRHFLLEIGEMLLIDEDFEIARLCT